MVNRSYTTNVSGTPTITGTTESIAVTSSGVSTAQPGEPIAIDGTLSITTGTGVTAVTVKCRRGTAITGTQVGVNDPVAIAASTSDSVPFTFQDTPGDVAGQQYVITVTQTGATGNGTVNGGAVTLTVGSP